MSMADQLELWSARLDALLTKATPAEKAAFHTQIDQLKAAGIAAFAKLGELKGATGDNWDVVKAEMVTIWHTIAAAIDNVEIGERAKEDHIKDTPVDGPVQQAPAAPAA